MKTIMTILLLGFGLISYGQSTTYSNNFGTNYVKGKTGSFNRSSFSWTISQNGTNYKINTNAIADAFTVTYSHFDSSNKLYVYIPIGSANFDGSKVVLVMTSEKLSDLAKGMTSQLNLLAILFQDNTGYMYKLNK